jgi:PTS system nitrogen regulatory IIA component
MGQSLLDLITPERVLPSFAASDKSALIAALADRIATLAGLDANAVALALAERERLSSTGVGAGIAIPHAQVAGLSRTIGMLARLDNPVEFAADDEVGVDLVVVILAPEGAVSDQLKALARVARVLRQRATSERLRQVRDAEAMHGVLAEAERSLGPA